MVRTYRRVEVDRRTLMYGKAPPYKEPTRQLDPLVYELRKRRYEVGISIPALAEIMGYDHTTIAAWECGDHLPGIRALRDWCKALGKKMEICDE